MSSLYQIPGPVHRDACGHGGYIASFDCVYKENSQPFHGNYDLYIFGDNQVCLRHESEDSAYHAIPNLRALFSVQDHEPFRTAIAVLSELGQFYWKPNEPATKDAPC